MSKYNKELLYKELYDNMDQIVNFLNMLGIKVGTGKENIETVIKISLGWQYQTAAQYHRAAFCFGAKKRCRFCQTQGVFAPCGQPPSGRHSYQKQQIRFWQ
mgnify:CR=1 FL=1